MLEAAQPTDEQVERMREYERRILDVFADGEDATIVLCVLDGVVSLVLFDLGVDVKHFAEGLRRTRVRLEEQRRMS